MRKTIFAACLMSLAAVAGCGDGEGRAPSRPQDAQPHPTQRSKRPPTPEEALGIETPGKLAASVEAWAGSNGLGDYFRQSRERLSRLHAQLIEDYNVRKESELEATDFTRETLRKYREAFDADSTLRQFMVECYSRKEVRPLPKTIARVFTTAIEDRGEIRANLKDAPAEIDRLAAELDSLKCELDDAGTATWSQEKELRIWRDLKIRVSDISSRANKASAQASALAANMAKAMRASAGADDVDALNDKAEQLKSDWSGFASRASRQLEIVNGQMLLTKFADDCKAMSKGVTAVPESLAKKKSRQAEIKELISRITSSRTRGYSDLSGLAQQAAAIKSRSRSEGGKEAELGKRVQKLAGNYEWIFGSSAIYRLKRDLPEPSAQARIDADLAAFKRAANIPAGSDTAGFFAGIESKAYQLSDRMEEESLLKRMDDTLLTVQRLAARRR